MFTMPPATPSPRATARVCFQCPASKSVAANVILRSSIVAANAAKAAQAELTGPTPEKEAMSRITQFELEETRQQLRAVRQGGLLGRVALRRMSRALR